ncbi:MAG TPA: MgtC/SapB family protein [Anaerohalosphaeraceae bacterium]|jgi:putative Mg2+ transporter-C (MgtC) family protein|nr:MgtC/SapB family protein [Anaerohalosphaeraceae bacterium]
METLINEFKEMTANTGLLSYLPPLLAALVYGGIIGIEREIHQKPAGLRTNMLICMGAAAFTLIAKNISINPDAETRVIQGVVTGVGFLGAGVLIHQQGNVQGLTTAATIWLVTAVGIACGARLYGLSAATVILAIIVLMGLYPLEQKMRKNHTLKNDKTSQ